MGARADKLIDDIHKAAQRAQAGGFSQSFAGQPNPKSGYMVSRRGAETTLDHPPTAADIADYVATNASHLKNKDHFLGYWPTGDGRHVLDVSRNIKSEEEAHEFGRKHKQESLYDLQAAKTNPAYNSTPIRKYSAEDESKIKFLHDNVVHSYNKIGPLDREAGKLWYEEEGQKIRDWADRKGVDHDKALQAFAALSPGQDWDQIHAVMSALHKHGPMVTSGQAGHAVQVGYGRDNFVKAHRILTEPDTSLEDVTTERAPKVRAFYSNLANPTTDADNVTIDGHAHNIGVNDFERVGIRTAPTLDVKKYRLVEEAYKRATQTVGAALPHHVQAATWIGYRRLDPRAAAIRADAVDTPAEHGNPGGAHDELSGLDEAWAPGRE